MELDNIKQRTTWNDASSSINSNFMKVRQAILALQSEGGGLDEAELEEYLTSHGYTKEEWVLAQNALLEERIENLEQGGGGGSANIEGSEFISVEDGKVALDVDIQGGLGNTGQGLGILEIPSADIITDALGYEPIKEEDISHVIQSVDTLESLEDVDGNQYVKYAPQYLTEEQKAQARENIGVSEAIDLGAFVTREEFEDVAESIDNKVDKEDGKGLSTEDFTSEMKSKLEGLKNYDDSEIKDALGGKQDVIEDLEEIRTGAAKGKSSAPLIVEADGKYVMADGLVDETEDVFFYLPTKAPEDDKAHTFAMLSDLEGLGGGGEELIVDMEMSDVSENAVANKVIKKYVDDKIVETIISTINTPV